MRRETWLEDVLGGRSEGRGGHGCRLSRKATGSAARGCYVCLKLMENEGRSRSSEPAVWRRGGVFPNAASGVQPLSTPPSDTAAAAPELKPLFSKRSVCGGGGGGRGWAVGTEGARTSTLPLDTLYKKRCWSEICKEYPTSRCDWLWKPIALQQMWLYYDVKYAPSA